MSEHIVDTFGIVQDFADLHENKNTSLYRAIMNVMVSRQREEIVRCHECEHYRFVDRSDIFHDNRHNDSFCLRFVDGKRMEVEPDGFCAWGERKQ